ncbi:M43 family zinc metalloprotease [Planctomycetota bacterium]|nr:M43 family zinc metalloprotease [Planctomycetota bacterium]
MRRFLLPAVAILVTGLAACSSGSGSGGFLSGLVQPFLGSAVRADVSGQEQVFGGTLGSGLTMTFPVVTGGQYLINVSTTDTDDIVVFDVIGDDGAALRSKSVDSGDNFLYFHEPPSKSQHVLVIARPRNPVDTGIEITNLTVTAVGAHPNDKVHVNVIVAGKFSGLGLYNDLQSTQDQADFTDALMAKVNALFNQAGIAVSYEGFFYTADQVSALHPNLVGTDDQTICSTAESVNGQGFETVSTADLDLWGNLGFDAADPDFNRAHGVNLFVIHHFTNDGTVGLSPRPGTLLGKGANTAMGVAGFLQLQGVHSPRNLDQMGLVAAHELGHFLGLLHTTTFDPSGINPTRAIDDGLSDTPECTNLADNNGDGITGLGDGCPDEDNVMFYMSGAQTQFTAKQAKVMQNILASQEH